MPRIEGVRLRGLRRARGWDVPELARRLRRAAGDDYVPPHDALVRMVRRWEREGLNTDRAERYELLFAAVFGVGPGELRGDEGAEPARDGSAGLPGSREAALGVQQGLQASNHPGDRGKGVEVALWRPAENIAGEGFGITPDDEDRIIHAVRRPARVDSRVVVPLRKILAAQRETEDVIGSKPMIEPITGQLATLKDLVTEARGPARPEVVDIAAQWAEYAGWLHTSISRWQEAHEWFDRASEWAVEADNSTLAATSLSFKGHLAFLLGQIGAMVGLTQAALRDSSSWVGQRAYDAHQLARGLALLGDSQTAVREVEKGTELALLADERSNEKPPWIYYYTLPFYALERGLVYRFLGRDNAAHNDEAISSLTAALNDIGEARSSEWAGDYIYHLAMAYAQSGSPDKACESAMELLRIAQATESSRLMERLNGIHARLAKRWLNDSFVTDLGEALCKKRTTDYFP